MFDSNSDQVLPVAKYTPVLINRETTDTEGGVVVAAQPGLADFRPRRVDPASNSKISQPKEPTVSWAVGQPVSGLTPVPPPLGAVS